MPIVAMTAHAIKDDIGRFLQAGMDTHVAKPVDPKRLYQVIEQLTVAMSAESAPRENGLPRSRKRRKQLRAKRRFPSLTGMPHWNWSEATDADARGCRSDNQRNSVSLWRATRCVAA